MDVEVFISRWTAREGGAERANYQMFLAELCRVLGVQEPEVSGADVRHNDYVFERAVRPRESDGGTAPKRIDLYKKNAFILEAKQSRMPGGKNAIPIQQSLLPAEDLETLGRRTRGPAWDVMMQNARKQAEGYVFLLDADQPAPPFIITCDVGHCLELFADFSGTGRAYNQFPDRNGFRIYMDDLRDPQVRARLAQVWTDPHKLDPTKTSARVTNEIAKRLAEVSKALEAKGCNAEDVAHFLMRCLFTMFAEDTDLLPKGAFCTLLDKSVKDPSHFQHRLKALWREMEAGAEFSPVIDARVRHFNGGLFKDTTVFDLGREEIGELLAAARANWKLVDPAIFGTLLEQALDKDERRRLGAHYTPRAYVQRLVDVTVMEPLREDWQTALKRAAGWRDLGDAGQAVAEVKAFHHKLCTTRVLDPACGTGNFLYVALEMMKQLEGEVLQALTDMGERQASLAMTGEESVDPHQFLGLELNPRAAAIAELVIWIGYLQWHYRNHETHPAEPILRAFNNINFGRREGYDAVLTWDGYPVPGVAVGEDGVRRETYPNARRPVWPDAEFIVGNPPFIGGANLRSRMAPGYAEALWAAHPQMNESADFVMYWWDRAAEIVSQRRTAARRFAFVTTNSITQPFQRRVVERHMNGARPVGLAFAIPDHPWTKASADSAAVRIAMTVGMAGKTAGRLIRIADEKNLDTDEPLLKVDQREGKINSDLTIGVTGTISIQLNSNESICHKGMQLNGQGFVLTEFERDHLVARDGAGAAVLIRPYVNGRDLTQISQRRFVIDTHGINEPELRMSAPATYMRLLELVKPERDAGREPSRRKFWWLHGRTHDNQRDALRGLGRYIATTRTAKHRIFSFMDEAVLSESKVVVVALNCAAHLSVLSSRQHKCWALHVGGFLEDRPTYQHVDCFNKFPFPASNTESFSALSGLGEELDSTRKLIQAENPDLTLTGLYNLIEKVKAGVALTPAEEDAKQRGRVLILKELHEQIDALTARAYGWPADLSDEEILARLVALNAERAKEEAAGHVRWLRPDYQIPRFAKGATAKTGELDLGDAVVAIDKALPPFPRDPAERPVAVAALLMMAARPMDAAELARGFKGGGKRVQQGVAQALTTLVRYGWVTPVGDGRFAARRAA